MADPASLSNLRDLAVPPPGSWWPPAPGWWILAAAGLVTAAILIAAAITHYRRNTYRREALRELDSADSQGISAILKRAALAAWPREEVASLSGPAWLAFLDRTGHTSAFTTGPASTLEEGTFGGTEGSETASGLRDAARAWLRDHRC